MAYKSTLVEKLLNWHQAGSKKQKLFVLLITCLFICAVLIISFLAVIISHQQSGNHQHANNTSPGTYQQYYCTVIIVQMLILHYLQKNILQILSPMRFQIVGELVESLVSTKEIRKKPLKFNNILGNAILVNGYPLNDY